MTNRCTEIALTLPTLIIKKKGGGGMGFLKQYGRALLDHGYDIVPIKTGLKHPGKRGWENIRADHKQLKQWLANGYANGGVGVLTKHTPAIDIDVRDSAVASAMVAYCELLFGGTVQRVGAAPKVALIYRTDVPFSKVMSQTYEDMFGQRHRVEVLGDGQQIVSYAVHPDTGNPYTWVGDGLADTALDALPVIDIGDARAIVDAFEKLAEDEGWAVVSEGVSGGVLDDGLGAGERALANVKPRVNVSTERLQSCLDHIEADDYHTWVKVGMALYHQYDGDAEGFGMWDAWSQTSDSYRERDCEQKWHTFQANLTRREPTTAATILRLSRLVDEHSRGDIVGAFLERYVYVQDGDRVCDLNKPPHCSISRLAEFRNRTANVRHEIPAPTAKDPDKTKLEPVWRSWMVQPKRKAAEGTVYTPKEGRVITDDYGLDWINEFHMPEFADTDGRDKLAVFFDHMSYLFPKPEEREWFISWMAFNIQYPERRSKVTPLHVSIAHGTGRGFLVELMGKMLGQWNCKKTKMSVLSGEGNGGGFHDFLHNSLFCAIEEVKEGTKRFAVSDRIRDLLTENRLEVNIKYGSKKTQPTFTNFFFMSNHPDALVLTKEDRRINVFQGPDEPRDRDYYDKLYAWLDTGGVNQLSSFLMQRDLSGFDWVRSMNTEARTRMIQNNRTETEVLFCEMMENPPRVFMTFRQIAGYLRSIAEGGEFDNDVDEKQLMKLLQHHTEQTPPLKVQGKKVRPWRLIQGRNLKNNEVRAEIEAFED